MPTPHINAGPGDFAKAVILPGDPLRARHIATTKLQAARQVTDVRNMLGFTGEYKGRPVSVMGSGMGIPSASIYCTELIKNYGVTHIIRAGSCGSIQPQVRLRDIVIGMGACTDSNVNRMRFNGHDFAALANYELLSTAVNIADTIARERQLTLHVGNLFSTDLFYAPDASMLDVLRRYHILGVEMEAAGIYGLAAEHGAKALTICTVSDHIIEDEKLSAEDRQTSFDTMIELALETAIAE